MEQLTATRTEPGIRRARLALALAWGILGPFAAAELKWIDPEIALSHRPAPARAM